MKKDVRKKRKMRFVWVLVLSVVLSGFVGAGIWLIGFAEQVNNPWKLQTPSVINTINPSHSPNASGNPGTDDPNLPTPTPWKGDELVWGKDVINILVIGYDKDEYREDRYSVFRTDTLILTTIYYKENRVVMTSIPRDSYVPIAENFSFKDKINSVPFHAQRQGVETYGAICSTVSRLFGGVPVDYYFAIDMDVFVDVIDQLGGIEYDVDVDVKYGDTILVHKGKQLLNGQQALHYVQFRGTASADIDRIYRQRRFLSAAFSQLKSFDKILKLPQIYSTVMDKVNTNLEFKHIANLANFAATNLEPNNISGQTFPGFFLNKNGISYWGIKQRERVHLIYNMFGITVPQDEQD